MQTPTPEDYRTLGSLTNLVKHNTNNDEKKKMYDFIVPFPTHPTPWYVFILSETSANFR